MESDFSDKIVIKYPPCKAPASCLDYEDYDPCGSSDNLNEKDLAVLLDEEQKKLKAERERKEKEGKAAEKEEKWTDKSDKGTETEGNKGKVEEASSLKDQEEKILKERKCFDKKLNNALNESLDKVEEEQTAKKRICKKFIKNPFFSNRLKFSSNHLPPPPHSPPPQFFPPVDQDSSKDRINCRTRKKKCKTFKERKKEYDKDHSKIYGSSELSEAEFSTRNQDGAGSAEEGSSSAEGLSSAGLSSADENAEANKRDDEAEEADESGGSTDDQEGRQARGVKKRCKKKEKPPCRKKESQIPSVLQPREIPPTQKDLPPTCPKEAAIFEKYRNRKLCCPVKKCKTKKSTK